MEFAHTYSQHTLEITLLAHSLVNTNNHPLGLFAVYCDKKRFLLGLLTRLLLDYKPTWKNLLLYAQHMKLCPLFYACLPLALTYLTRPSRPAKSLHPLRVHAWSLCNYQFISYLSSSLLIIIRVLRENRASALMRNPV